MKKYEAAVIRLPGQPGEWSTRGIDSAGPRRMIASPELLTSVIEPRCICKNELVFGCSK